MVEDPEQPGTEEGTDEQPGTEEGTDVSGGPPEPQEPDTEPETASE